MTYVLLFCQLVLAAVLLIAATGKLINSEQLAAALRLSHVPYALIAPLVVFLPILEMSLALGLVFDISSLLPFFLILTGGLLSVFTLWMLIVSLRRLHLQCGCFGPGRSEINRWSILRNIVFIALSVGGLIATFQARSPLPVPSLWMLVTVLSGGMCIMLLWSFWLGKSALFLSVAQLTETTEGS